MPREVGLIIALRKTIMDNCPLDQFKKEWADLTTKDREELVVEYNKCKTLGDDVVVVMKAL